MIRVATVLPAHSVSGMYHAMEYQPTDYATPGDYIDDCPYRISVDDDADGKTYDQVGAVYRWIDDDGHVSRCCIDDSGC